MSTSADRIVASSLKRVQAQQNSATQSKRRKKTARAESTHNLDNEGVHDRNSPARQADARTRVDRDSDLPTTWVRPSALMAPPARAGYVNRWIRFRSGNEEDRDNLDKMMSQGWRPIPKSKLRKDHALTANLEGKYGQYVTKRGLILMELPEDLWQQRRAFYEKKKDVMTESIDRNLFREQDRRMPFTTPERRTTVTRKARRGRLEDNIPGDED
jgi:hypothetical protein